MKRAKQLAMPFGPFCCAQAARLGGWTRGRMARAFRRHRLLQDDQRSVRGVKVTKAQIEEMAKR